MFSISSILRGAWSIEPSYADSYGVLVARMLNGDSFSDMKQEFIETHETTQKTDSDKFVAHFWINSVITKYDQYCGNRGMLWYANALNSVLQDSDCQGVILIIDSGGGEAKASHELIKEIREAQKPVLALVHGMACSAAYDIASACHEVYASSPTDMVGSIGTFMEFADMRPLWEEKGVKFHKITATKSTLKNSDFEEARKGNYKPLQERIINPLQEAFESRVREHRNGKINTDFDKEIFAGQVFRASENTGLIDGIKDFDSVYQRVMKLSQKNISTYNNSNMNQEQSESLIQSTIKAMTGYVPQSQFEALQAQVKDLTSELSEKDKVIEAQKSEIVGLKADVEKFGSQPGAMHTEVKSSGKEIEVDNEALAEYNRISEQVEASVKGGGEWM